MKELKFTTGKGEFILVEDEPNLSKIIPWDFCEFLGVVKTMTEEQFADVVDSELDSHLNPNYKDYLHDYNSGFEDEYIYYTAKESFESLVKSLGYYLFENPYQYDWDELCRYGHGDFSKNGKSSYDLYMEAELKTFRNPILLKKI